MPAAVLPKHGLSVLKKEVIFWIRFLNGAAKVCPKRKEKNGLALKKDYLVVVFLIQLETQLLKLSLSTEFLGWRSKGVRQGRYFASEFLREPEYQKKIANKAKPLARKAVNYTIDSISGDLLNKASNKLRPKDMIPGRG